MKKLVRRDERIAHRRVNGNAILPVSAGDEKRSK
jgi:hypothetical protein